MISSYGDNEGTTTTLYPYKWIKADAELYKQLGNYHIHYT